MQNLHRKKSAQINNTQTPLQEKPKKDISNLPLRQQRLYLRDRIKR